MVDVQGHPSFTSARWNQATLIDPVDPRILKQKEAWRHREKERPRNYDGRSQPCKQRAELSSDALAGRRSCRNLKPSPSTHYPSTHYRERDGEGSTDAGNEKEISKDSVAVGTSRRRVEME